MDSPAPEGPLIADVGSGAEVVAALEKWGLAGPRPVLVCVGGATGMAEEHLGLVRAAFRDHLFPELAQRRAVVVDGGTRHGVMRLLGETVGNHPVPLLGVAAGGTITVPGRPAPTGDAAHLEPHHTGVLIVEGSEWGTESPWIASVAGLVAGRAPSATLLVNGGDIAYRDARASVEAGRTVVAVAGTGRAADVIAGALIRDDGRTDRRAAELAASGLVRAVSIADPVALAALVGELLGGEESSVRW